MRLFRHGLWLHWYALHFDILLALAQGVVGSVHFAFTNFAIIAFPCFAINWFELSVYSWIVLWALVGWKLEWRLLRHRITLTITLFLTRDWGARLAAKFGFIHLFWVSIEWFPIIFAKIIVQTCHTIRSTIYWAPFVRNRIFNSMTFFWALAEHYIAITSTSKYKVLFHLSFDRRAFASFAIQLVLICWENIFFRLFFWMVTIFDFSD